MTAKETPFDLDRLVREVLKEAADPNPPIIAEVVFRRIPVEQYAAVVRQLLPGFVTDVIGRMRREVLSLSAGRLEQPLVTSPPTPNGVPAPRDKPAKAGKARQPMVPDAGEYASHHTAYVNTHYEDLMNMVMAAGRGKGQQKRFGQFTIADVRAAQEIRRSHAASNTIRADELAAVEQAMVEHQVRFIKELPKDVILGIYPNGVVR